MVLSCLSVRASMRLSVHASQYLAEYLTHFYQTYINDALWDRNERVTVWGQRSRSRWDKV